MFIPLANEEVYGGVIGKGEKNAYRKRLTGLVQDQPLHIGQQLQ